MTHSRLCAFCVDRGKMLWMGASCCRMDGGQDPVCRDSAITAPRRTKHICQTTAMWWISGSRSAFQNACLHIKTRNVGPVSQNRPLGS